MLRISKSFLVIGLVFSLVGGTYATDAPDIIETAKKNGSFKTLVAAIEASGLEETLQGAGPFTVFAPTDEAFAKLPQGTIESLLKPENQDKLRSILTYHVALGRVLAKNIVKLSSAETAFGQEVAIKVNDSKVTVDGANVVQTDIQAKNGVIHVIDSVLLPKDIVDLALEAGSFTTLVKAIQAAGLEETLRGDGPFTVFAPTDEAFAKIPADTLNDLLKPENKQKLQAILTYHVVPGKVLAKDVTSLSSAKTVNGEAVAVKNSYGKVKIDNATVVKTDMVAANGVIHVIDAVMLPTN